VLAYHALRHGQEEGEEEEEEEEATSQGGGHALAQQRRAKNQQQQTSHGGPMYCMSNLTSVLVEGWSTKQSKHQQNPTSNKSQNALFLCLLTLASFLYLNRGRNHIPISD
jgi:hypothetical protein